MPSHIFVIIDQAPLTPAEKSLEIINNNSFKTFAPDVHVLMSDDVMPLTWHWDEVINMAVSQGLDAFCWEEQGDPNNQTYLILTKKYAEALVSYLPIWFPFWFSDTWRNEIYIMVFHKSMPIVRDLKIGGKRGKTHGLQDVEFWFDFFARTRPQRIKEAEVLANNLGIEFKHENIPMDFFLKWDESQKYHFDRYMYVFSSNPSAQYSKAKIRALLHLHQIDKK